MDSMNPHTTQMEGNYDSAKKTLTMMTKGKDPAGQTTQGKNVMVYKDKDTRLFTMYTKQGDKYEKMMEITYTRKK